MAPWVAEFNEDCDDLPYALRIKELTEREAEAWQRWRQRTNARPHMPVRKLPRSDEKRVRQ